MSVGGIVRTHHSENPVENKVHPDYGDRGHLQDGPDGFHVKDRGQSFQELARGGLRTVQLGAAAQSFPRKIHRFESFSIYLQNCRTDGGEIKTYLK